MSEEYTKKQIEGYIKDYAVACFEMSKVTKKEVDSESVKAGAGVMSMSAFIGMGLLMEKDEDEANGYLRYCAKALKELDKEWKS